MELLSVDPVMEGDGREWRTHAKLVAGKAGSTWAPGVRLGLYSAGTHAVVPIPRCSVHHPSINAAVRAIQEATEEAGVVAYDEVRGEGMLRYCQLSVERSSGKVQATLVWNTDTLTESSPHSQRLLRQLQAQSPELFHSVWFNWNTGRGNTIVARDLRKW